VFDEVHILFHFNIIFKHNGMSTRIKTECYCMYLGPTLCTPVRRCRRFGSSVGCYTPKDTASQPGRFKLACYILLPRYCRMLHVTNYMTSRNVTPCYVGPRPLYTTSAATQTWKWAGLIWLKMGTGDVLLCGR
jgi:hypothetical protein